MKINAYIGYFGSFEFEQFWVFEIAYARGYFKYIIEENLI